MAGCACLSDCARLKDRTNQPPTESSIVATTAAILQDGHLALSGT
jgi:hypothetical protein